MDNRRLLAARQAGIDVEANVHNYNDPLPADQVERFTVGDQVPSTWGEAIRIPTGSQSGMSGADSSWSDSNPNGSIYDPGIVN